MSDRVTSGINSYPKCEKKLGSIRRKRKAIPLGMSQRDPSSPYQHIRDLYFSKEPGTISAATEKGRVSMGERGEEERGR